MDRSMRYCHLSDPSLPDCDLIRSWLGDFNRQANREFMERRELPEHQTRPLGIVAKSDEGQVVGGLLGETQFAWLKIAIMAVAPERRGKGIGKALVAEAEREAIARGCRYAYVDTMEYQAPRFYEAWGYTIVGRLDDWDSHGHAKLFLTKRLACIQ